MDCLDRKARERAKSSALITNRKHSVEYSRPPSRHKAEELTKTLTLTLYKKLSYRRGTARCVVSIEILPIERDSAETTYTTSPDQTDRMKLEI